MTKEQLKKIINIYELEIMGLVDKICIKKILLNNCKKNLLELENKGEEK